MGQETARRSEGNYHWFLGGSWPSRPFAPGGFAAFTFNLGPPNAGITPLILARFRRSSVINGQSAVLGGVGTIDQELLRRRIVSERRKKRGKKARQSRDFSFSPR